MGLATLDLFEMPPPSQGSKTRGRATTSDRPKKDNVTKRASAQAEAPSPQPSPVPPVKVSPASSGLQPGNKIGFDPDTEERLAEINEKYEGDGRYGRD